MLAWTRMEALEVVRNVKILGVFWRQSQNDLLMGRICGVRERAKGDPKACDLSYRDGVTIYCNSNKGSSPARPPHSSVVSESWSSPCAWKPSGAGGHVWKEKRTKSHAIHSSPQVGLGRMGHMCLSRFTPDQKSHTFGFFHKEFLGMGLLPAYRAPPPRTAFQLGSNWE